jgi:hypothetical protein
MKSWMFARTLKTVALLAAVATLTSGCFLVSPTVDFTYTLSQGTPPCEVEFDGSSSRDPYGSIVWFDWDFGDGSTGSGQLTTHTYTTSGAFPVQLSATNSGGRVGKVSKTITVLPTYVPPPSLPPYVLPPDTQPPTFSNPLRFEGHESPQVAPTFPSEVAVFMEYVGDYEGGIPRGCFRVAVLDALHQRLGQLVDTTARYFMGRIDNVGGPGPYFLDIVALGDWAITVYTGGESLAPPQTFRGCSSLRLSQFSPLFDLRAGPVAFYFDRPDMVLFDYLRNTETPLFHEMDVLGGTYAVGVPGGGCWEVSVEQRQ